MKFTLNDKEYRLIDLDTEATIRMEEVASTIFSESLETILTQKNTFSFGDFLKGLMSSNNMRKAIALIVWEKEETKFDKAKYEERINEFLDMPLGIRKQLAPEVESFFDGIGDSLAGDFRIFSGAAQKLAPKNTEKQ